MRTLKSRIAALETATPENIPIRLMSDEQLAEILATGTSLTVEQVLNLSDEDLMKLAEGEYPAPMAPD